MKTVKVLVLLSVAALLASGCAFKATPVVNNVDVSSVDFSKVDSFKEGKACATFLLGFKVDGDASVVSAVKNGGLRKVKAIDQEVKDFLLVRQLCVTVYGN
ncbi:MAG: hypothetical protein GWO11_04605 [Desulfuromonadales bacterium]|nr:hypothetical protein [Desulfuromonadales bacterium]NIR33696.1 hypothetical protein [Desulfuromonadales bacterium]NIS44018.1 hypothetical protein [Desulfuromonadales bacterium]